MNLRFAAAIALVLLLAACGTGLSVKMPQTNGWEIMQPPQIEGRPYPSLDETAPLSEWVVAPADIDIYPSQAECEQIIENWREGSRREDFQQAAKRDDSLRCVSIGDPRLKEK